MTKRPYDKMKPEREAAYEKIRQQNFAHESAMQSLKEREAEMPEAFERCWRSKPRTYLDDKLKQDYREFYRAGAEAQRERDAVTGRIAQLENQLVDVAIRGSAPIEGEK